MTILYLGPNAFQVKLFLAFTVRNYISQFFIQFFDLFCRWSLTLSVKPLYKYMREEGEEEKIAWEGNLYIYRSIGDVLVKTTTTTTKAIVPVQVRNICYVALYCRTS